MPIGPFEGRLLRLLSENRSPDSFVGGATVLHRSGDSPRASRDIDLFHDRAEAVQAAAERDLATLGAAGLSTNVTARHPEFWRATVGDGSARTKLEWVQDSAFRFFPVEPDVELGWRLNFWDAATNKILALAGRDKLRDKLDALYLHRSHLHLGALAWTASGKDPGMTPELILDQATRFGRLPSEPEEWHGVGLEVPRDLSVLKREFLEMINSAREVVTRLPPAELGCLYLDPQTLKPVCPAPEKPDFAGLIRHYGHIGGAWPRVVD